MKSQELKRVAILGTESSHARAFAELLKKKSNVTLIGAYGTDAKANKAFTEAYGVPCEASPDAFLGEADGVLITARNGADHLSLARPYLTPGMSVFVDKPLCNEVAEATELLSLARANRVNLTGGSCLKHSPALLRLHRQLEMDGVPVVGASFSAPVEMDSIYGGFYFYAPHLIEMALTVLGNGIRSVRAIRQGNTATALLCYESFCASLFFGCDAYSASVSLQTHERHTSVGLGSIFSLYGKELSLFCDILTGKSPLPDISVLADHVTVACAIKEAYETGNEIFLR